MTNIDFNRKYLASETRAYLYKTLARPVLIYGLEPFVMTANDKKIISTTEGNLVKGLLGLSRNLRAKHLLAAVNVDPIANKIKVDKLYFILQLNKNDLTRKLMNHMMSNRTNSNIKSLMDEAIEIICDYEDKTSIESFHGP